MGTAILKPEKATTRNYTSVFRISINLKQLSKELAKLGSAASYAIHR